MNHAYPKYGDADFNGGNQQAVLNCGRDTVYIYIYVQLGMVYREYNHHLGYITGCLGWVVILFFFFGRCDFWVTRFRILAQMLQPLKNWGDEFM